MSIVTPQEWKAARQELLVEEKQGGPRDPAGEWRRRHDEYDSGSA
jgi:hypothetical protein